METNTNCPRCGRNVKNLAEQGEPTYEISERPPYGAFPNGLGGWWCHPCLAMETTKEILKTVPNFGAMDHAERLNAYTAAQREAEMCLRLGNWTNPFNQRNSADAQVPQPA
jgi:hypothetical protein